MAKKGSAAAAKLQSELRASTSEWARTFGAKALEVAHAPNGVDLWVNLRTMSVKAQPRKDSGANPSIGAYVLTPIGSNAVAVAADGLCEAVSALYATAEYSEVAQVARLTGNPRFILGVTYKERNGLFALRPFDTLASAQAHISGAVQVAPVAHPPTQELREAGSKK